MACEQCKCIVILIKIPTTDCGGEALSTGHDTTRGKGEETYRGVHHAKDGPNLLADNI
jgi:hypothetical protein